MKNLKSSLFGNLYLTFAVGAVIGAGGLLAFQQFGSGHSNQPYSGQEQRQISSLSPKDIDDLIAGKGWGLAKPAEFNGYPGPSHVLEFAEKLELTVEQKQAVESSFAFMQARAQKLGADLVDAEAKLDELFRSMEANNARLEAVVAEAEKVRAALRSTHLSAHLEVTPILTNQQKELYASLRGYGSGHSEHSGH